MTTEIWVYLLCSVLLAATILSVVAAGAWDNVSRHYRQRLLVASPHRVALETEPLPPWGEMLRVHRVALRLLGNRPEASYVDAPNRSLVTYHHDSRNGMLPRRCSSSDLREAVAKLRSAANSLAVVADWLDRQGDGAR